MVKIAQYDLEGNLVDTHKSGADAHSDLGLDPKNLRAWRRTCARALDFKGFVWRRCGETGGATGQSFYLNFNFDQSDIVIDHPPLSLDVQRLPHACITFRYSWAI
jgi:hypothetical protein